MIVAEICIRKIMLWVRKLWLRHLVKERKHHISLLVERRSRIRKPKSSIKVGNIETIQLIHLDRVRKGAPVELGRQAKIAGSQQKLVKKIGGEPLKINRVSKIID